MASFRSSRAWIVAAACLATMPADASIIWRKVSDREFPGWRAEVQRVADRAQARVAHVCVVVRGDSARSGERVLLAYFREDRLIQGFGRPAASYPLDDTSMAGFDAIDLRRDVVATDAQVNGSISRVTKAYVDNIVARCRSKGTRIVVTKRAH